MLTSRKQIVCISTHYWDDSWFRKQQFMSRFIKNGYMVAYIEPSFSMARKPDADKINFQTNRLFKIVVERKNSNLFIIKPPQALPFWSKPNMSNFNYSYFSLRLSRALKDLGFENYILWVYNPEYVAALNNFHYRKLVVDLVDDLAAYGEGDRKKHDYMKNLIETIIDKSDLLIVTAHTLMEKYKKLSKRICLIPNGYDSALFSERSVRPMNELKEINTAIIGFIGTLFSFLDYELIEYLIKENPEKSFVFIGNCEENARQEWTRITQYKNVIWLGKKPKEDIPSYINEFDVCINPFKVNNVSRSVSPLKVFEYLAMKKPVVSVKMESLENEEAAPFIYFASTYKEFNEKLQFAIEEKDLFRDKLNYQIVGKYSWDTLFQKGIDNLAALETHQ